MTATEFERRLGKLALREGMTFASFISLGGADRAVLNATILAHFDADAAYNEREVNEELKAWLAGAGSMIATDHVSLRRLLVDTQALARTADCAEYRLQQRPATGLAADLAALDAEAIVANARRADAERRAARKAAWLQRADGPGNPGAA